MKPLDVAESFLDDSDERRRVGEKVSGWRREKGSTGLAWLISWESERRKPPGVMDGWMD